MEKVMVIGSPGAGKSTFASALSRRCGLPVVHLDAEYWQPGWVEYPADAWLEKLDRIIAAPTWVIDGNYGGSLPQRLAAADTVVLLDFPTWLCLWRLIKRVWTFHGRSRPDVAADCPERFDITFLFYVLMFRTNKTPRNEALLSRFNGTIHRFRRPAEAETWLKTIAAT